MHRTATFFFALLAALTARVALAQTPACLIAAVNEQPDPSNMEAICSGSNTTAVRNYACKNCGDNIKAALSEFEGACLAAGMMVSTEDACSSKGGSGSGSQSSITSSIQGGASSTTTTGDSDATASPSQSSDGAEPSNAAVDIGARKEGVAAALVLAALAAR